jgi:hypothetical protein
MLKDYPDLEGCEAKFGRGKAHAQELRAKVGESLGDYAYPFRGERDEDARKYVFYIEELPTLDPEWSLIFGDAIHNFRATLDHLTVQLAILGQKRALTPDEVQAAGFPVLEKPDDWKLVAGPNKVKLLRSGERERIRELQPFNATDQSIWGRDATVYGGVRPPRLIYALHLADIFDKHRFVHPSWYAVKDVEMPDIAGIQSTAAHGQRLEAGSELGEWGFFPEGPFPELPADLDISRYFPLAVEFDYGYSMVEFIDEIESLIERIIDLFRPALTSRDPTPPVTSLL